MARQMTQQTDPFVDPAAIAAEVFNVDFSLTSADALIAQLESAVQLDEEKKTSRPGGTPARCDCPTSQRLRLGAGPYATAYLAAQVLQENVAQLSEIEPIEVVRGDDGCDHRTIVALIKSSVAAIVKELNKPEPLVDRVSSYLKTLVEYRHDPNIAPTALDPKTVGGNLGRLGKRFSLDEKACSVKDEQAQVVFGGIVQFTSTLLQSWHTAQKIDSTFLSTATYSLQRSLRGIVVTVEQLRMEVPSSAWVTYQLQTEPPVVALDLYQWIHDYASAGALNELKQGRDGIHNVNRIFTDIKALVEHTLKPSDADDACNAAFAKKRVQKIVTELICHMQRVVTVTANLA